MNIWPSAFEVKVTNISNPLGVNILNVLPTLSPLPDKYRFFLLKIVHVAGVNVFAKRIPWLKNEFHM
jgi:hypothetical protein